MAVEVRCPMRECRKRIDLETLPSAPAQGERPPCLHFIAAWGGSRGDRATAVLWALDGNREFRIRNLRAAEVERVRIDEVRGALDLAAARFAHEVDAGNGAGALFGDQHERNRVAFDFALAILGADPAVPTVRGGEAL
jgi:hypothetical protein